MAKAAAQPLPPPVARTVIALSSTAQNDRNSPRLDYVHQILQMPLNHLGVVVHSHNVEDGLPDDVDMASVRGVITYFRPGDHVPEWVMPWLEACADSSNTRIVHLGSIAPLAESQRSRVRVRKWLERFGLGWDDHSMAGALRVEVTGSRDTAFEGPNWGPIVHRGPWNESEANHVWLSTDDLTRRDRVRTPVVTGPWGGVAMDPWLVRVGGEHRDRRWHVNPFRFFAEALDLRGVPAPDPNVVHGRRAFFLHVDGDGFESESTVEEGEFAAKVFLDEIVDRYALPMSISVIVAGLTDDLAVEEPTERMRLAAEILARPNVEAASHAVLHPMNWRRRKSPRSAPRTITWYDGLANYEHDMVAEVRESIRFVNERLLADGKRCEMMFWSGYANPSEESLLEVTRSGARNINGGVFRWDGHSNSVGFVEPWGKQVGSAFQVYAGAANENVFDGFFTTMPGSFEHISTTLENTGRDRILKPANIYVHFYSAERPARLEALQRLVERWAYAESTAPVFASDYARAVDAAQHTCRIHRLPDGWAFRGFDGCPTLRIDDEPRTVDWGKSRNVVGATRIGGSLYLHLGGPEGEVALGENRRAWPHIGEANHLLTDVKMQPRQIEFVSSGIGTREVVVAGFPPGSWVEQRVGDQANELHVDERGRLRIDLTGPATKVMVIQR